MFYMTILVIIILILIGVLLLLLEILVVPGVTIAGIGGALFIAAGVYMSYNNYGNNIGHLTVVFSIAIAILAIVLALKSKTWDKLSLKSKITSKVETFANDSFNVGDSGLAITRIAPIGKARINNISVEVKSIGMYIDENSEIEIVRIEYKTIVVKPKK